MTAILIAIVVVFSLLGCLWLIWATSKRKADEVAEGEVKDHVWDDDLREFNNPLPRWWLYLFVITVIFAFAYMAFYPGLVIFEGASKWSSSSEMQARLDELHQRREALFARFEGQGVPQLAANAEAVKVGAGIFGNHCAGCHGSNAKGAVGYPNLSDSIWNYGGEPAQILASISNGRAGVMPPMGAGLTPEQLDSLITAVREWPEDASHPGRQLFAQRCIACHGPEGKGMPVLGAPNLTDNDWLWGGDKASIEQTIMAGRSNRMPAHSELLEPAEIQLVAAYVYSLSASAAP